jgi:penicillin-binding protein 2
MPGDTLQASIGQSDHLFSPLQITMYISTLLNNGTRYSAHILHKVCPYGSDEPSFVQENSVIEKMDISEEACTVVKNAMRDVIENGSASEMFEDYPLTIGGKTGTAQVSKVKSDNAIFTAFAPFDDPELVVTCVIEQGNTGANAGVSVKGLFDYYFELDKIEDDGGADE